MYNLSPRIEPRNEELIESFLRALMKFQTITVPDWLSCCATIDIDTYLKHGYNIQ